MPKNVAYETARCELYLAERHVLKTARALLTAPNGTEAASELIAAVAGLEVAEQRFTLRRRRCPCGSSRCPGYPPKRYVVRQGLDRGKGAYLNTLLGDRLVASWTTLPRRRMVFTEYDDAFDAAADHGGRVILLKKVPRGRQTV